MSGISGIVGGDIEDGKGRKLGNSREQPGDREREPYDGAENGYGNGGNAGDSRGKPCDSRGNQGDRGRKPDNGSGNGSENGGKTGDSAADAKGIE